LDFLEEIPVSLTDYSLTTSMLLTLGNLITPYEEIDFPDNGYLLKNFEGICQSMNELSKEHTVNFLNWQKNVTKQEQLQQQFISKRKQEIDIAKSKGQTLPEPNFESENPKLFKKPPEPDRFESLLLDYQIDYYSNQINEYLYGKNNN